jgi:hypothetical protein
MYLRLVACGLVLAPLTVSAQTVAPAPVFAPVAAAPVFAPVSGNAVLRSGTEVPLRLSEELTTKNKSLRIGQRFRMETTVPVVVQGVTVIPTGSPAVGEITEVRNKGGWGKSGHFGARVLSVTANGRQIRLSGAFDDKGKAGGVGAVAVSALIFAPAGFFMTGTSAQLPVGTPVKGFVDEDIQLALSASTPAPMVVSAPAPVASAPAKGM